MNAKIRDFDNLLNRVALAIIPFALASTGTLAKDNKPVLPEILNNLPLPVDCDLGRNCFFQSLPDLDPGSGVSDSYCNKASYDGHKGTDIRVRSMRDAAKGKNVLAVMDGEVLRGRDNMEDKLVRKDADRKRIEGVECGNGVVIDHGDGLQTQYCHMMRGSLVVRPGDKVKAGDVLGKIGASGMTEFPHVHISFTVNGRELDPNTGNFLDDGLCLPLSKAKPVWNEAIIDNLKAGQSQLLEAGISGIPPDHESLVLVGGPPPARPGEPVTIGWAWFSNLQKGDTIHMALYRDGKKLVENTSSPVERSKASYSQYIGKRQKFAPGDYRLETRLLRKGNAILSDIAKITVK